MQVSRFRYAVLIMLLGLVASLTATVPAFAASDCPSGQTQFKIDSRPGNGTYGDGTLSVTISNADEDSFSWSSNITVTAVMVKAGTTLKANPGGRSGTASSAENPNNGRSYGISHVSFCYSDDDDGGEEKGQGTEDDCSDNNAGKDCDTTDCPGNGNGNMGKDCDTEEEDDCPGNGNGNGSMSDDCDEDEDEPCLEDRGNGAMDKDCDKDAGDSNHDSDDEDDTLGDVDERPSLPDDRQPDDDGNGQGTGDAIDDGRTGPAADVRGLRVAAGADKRGSANTPQVGAQQGPGRTLPFTGFAVLPFLLVGVGLVTAGVLLRARRAQGPN